MAKIRKRTNIDMLCINRITILIIILSFSFSCASSRPPNPLVTQVVNNANELKRERESLINDIKAFDKSYEIWQQKEMKFIKQLNDTQLETYVNFKQSLNSNEYAKIDLSFRKLYNTYDPILYSKFHNLIKELLLLSQKERDLQKMVAQFKTKERNTIEFARSVQKQLIYGHMMADYNRIILSQQIASWQRRSQEDFRWLQLINSLNYIGTSLQNLKR